jgi:glycosyltransferase involved in cell wall biosynthesis
VEKISVTLIVLNEEGDVRGCLESVGWADEIIVSDSGSTDSTVEICRAYGCRVFVDEWLGFGAQKNLCAGRARNDWILNVDADERVTPGLRAEILGLAAGKGRASGYYIPRKNYFGERWIRRCGWYPDYTLRLYDRRRGGFAERAVHEAVSVDGAKAYLEGPLEHRTYRDVSDYLVRMQRYSTLAAEEMLKDGRDAGILDVTFRPALTFLKMYVLKAGFLEGFTGAVLSGLYASYTLAKYAKLREMKRGALRRGRGIGGEGGPDKRRGGEDDRLQRR